MVLQFQEAMLLQILDQAEVAVVRVMETAVMVQRVFSSLVSLRLKHRRLYQYNTVLSPSMRIAISKSPQPTISFCQESQDRIAVLRSSSRTIPLRVS